MARNTSGTGSVYRPKDRAVWWLSYYVHGRRVRESSGSTVKADALALLKQRLGELGTGRYVGPAAERLTFEDLLDGVERAYQLAGRRSLRRVQEARGALGARLRGLACSGHHGTGTRTVRPDAH